MVEVVAATAAAGEARQRRTILYHAAPYIVGFIELIHKHPLLGTVVALERVECLEVDRAAYLGILQRNHQLAINVVKMLSELLWQTAEDRRVRLFGSVDHLVANSLCYLARLYGEERSSGVLITKELNKSALAESLGVARRSVIRAIENLEAEGLVEISGRQVWIPDLRALQRRARDPFDAPEALGAVR
jgi:CRP-like cAMP-binding protein